MNGPGHAEKTITQLVRVARANVEEIKARIADLEAAKGSAETSLDWFEQAIRAEETAKGEGGVVAAEFARFLEGAAEKRTALTSTRDTLIGEIETLRGMLGEAYAELKKLEHLVDISRRTTVRREKRISSLRLRSRGAA